VVDHLPNEIFLVVFHFAVASTSFNNFLQVVSLTHVSRRWRNILLNYGRIWSNIYIHGQDFNQLGVQINRCRQAPLLVSIDPPPSTAKPSRHNELLKNIHMVANLIRERRNQVTHLGVHMECGLFYRLFGCDWPGLKELNFHDSCFWSSSFHDCREADPAHGGLPKLKVLVVGGSPNWPMKVATHLTVFKLEGTVNLKLETLAKFLRMNTSLKTLELKNLSVRGSPGWQREEPIELPHLDELSVRDATCGYALALLRLPSLKQLRVSSSGEQDPWKHSPWAEFCSQLFITSLEATYRSSWDDGVTVIGSSDGIDAQSLRFTEFNSPEVIGTSLFGSLSNASLSSVTSLSLIKNMPEGHMSPSLVAAMCDLLNHLPRVERMRLRPSKLVVEFTRRLSGDSKLCPMLRELAMRVTEKACKTVLKLVAGMKARTEARRKITVILLQGGEAETRVMWNKL
jgi:hypothetical protein